MTTTTDTDTPTPAIWIGGPWDGSIVAIPAGLDVVKVAIVAHDDVAQERALDPELAAIADVDYRLRLCRVDPPATPDARIRRIQWYAGAEVVDS